jgi:hypothetical protein
MTSGFRSNRLQFRAFAGDPGKVIAAQTPMNDDLDHILDCSRMDAASMECTFGEARRSFHHH